MTVRKFVQYNLLPAIMNATASGYGLLDETATIGTRERWERRLAERGFQIRGHRLVRRRGKGRRGGTTKLTKHTKREDVEREGRVCLGLAASEL